MLFIKKKNTVLQATISIWKNFLFIFTFKIIMIII